jgi:DNA-binding transcriptional ArsR family regulator
MREGPDISRIAALIGNPACANMLMALMPGLALTATELAHEASLGLPATSGHLAKLHKARLVGIERQGRHHYYRLADHSVAIALEGLMPLAERAGHVRTRTGPRDPELRRARSCYDHLAGDLAVKMFDCFSARRFLARDGDDVHLTDAGRKFFAKEGFDLEELACTRRPLCRPCLDWSERRSHLSGTLGAAIFDRVLAGGWAIREKATRVVRFSPEGERKMSAWFSR